MNKNFKRVLAFILSAMMVLSLVPTSLFAFANSNVTILQSNAQEQLSLRVTTQALKHFTLRLNLKKHLYLQ